MHCSGSRQRLRRYKRKSTFTRYNNRRPERSLDKHQESSGHRAMLKQRVSLLELAVRMDTPTVQHSTGTHVCARIMPSMLDVLTLTALAGLGARPLSLTYLHIFHACQFLGTRHQPHLQARDSASHACAVCARAANPSRPARAENPGNAGAALLSCRRL